MTAHYNLESIRALLTNGFSEKELRYFCFDHSNFRDVHYQLSESTGISQIAHQLLEHAERKELLGFLLDWAKKQNPAKYEKYKPYCLTPSIPTSKNEDYQSSQNATNQFAYSQQFQIEDEVYLSLDAQMHKQVTEFDARLRRALPGSHSYTQAKNKVEIDRVLSCLAKDCETYELYWTQGEDDCDAHPMRKLSETLWLIGFHECDVIT